MERVNVTYRHLVRSFFLAAMGMAFISQAQASSMTLLSEERYVSVANTAPVPDALLAGLTTTNPAAAPFNNAWLSLQGNIPWVTVEGFKPDATRALGTQDVFVSAGEVQVAHFVEVEAGGDPLGLKLPSAPSGTARAESYFELTFSVDRPTGYTYEYDLAGGPVVDTAELILDSLNNGSQTLDPTSGAPVFGVLAPDTYTLRMRLVGAASGLIEGSASSDLNFAVLPEPSTALLLGGGLLLFARARGRA